MTSSERGVRAWPDHHAELTALLPLVLSVWMDGVLSAEELATLRSHFAEAGWLGTEAETALAPWLDPERPPTADELQELGGRIRAADLNGDESATRSITDLGLALWRDAGAAPCCWNDATSVERLRGLEASLGILGAEAARRMAHRPPEKTDVPAEAPAFDPDAARAALRDDYGALRDEVKGLLHEPPLAIELGLDHEEYRARVLEAVRFLAEQGYGARGFPEAHGGGGDTAAAVAVFESLAFGDLSVLVKFGVQFGLFGGSVLQLGTERHHARYLPAIGTMELPGCYAMTETDHGSNVRDLDTTATYDPETDELVVHTPHRGAGKDWIGNAARDGRLATVFARLLVDGRDHGVHALLVPVRDDDGTLADGVTIEDRGLKLGLNGVDNGRIWFDSVRVPRESLLDRFAQIDDDGVYQSLIASSGRRFFTMLRTLVAGRVSIASASVSATKVGLTIALRYAARRRQFGSKDAPERPILEYPAIHESLLPALATTYGLHFAVRALQRDYAAVTPETESELEVAAAGLKAYATDHCTDVLQACREACGGRGYLAENRFAALKADTDVFTTFEGANAVLYQLVAKGLLSRYRDQMGHLDLWRGLQYLGERAETAITELNPVATRRTDRDHLLDPEFHAAALAYREQRLLRSAAQRIRSRLQDGTDSFDAFVEVQDHLISLAKAHVERTIHERFLEAASEFGSRDFGSILGQLAALSALSAIKRDRAWFLEAGYVEPGKSRAIRAEVARLSRELAAHATELVAVLDVPESILPPLARSGSERPTQK